MVVARRAVHSFYLGVFREGFAVELWVSRLHLARTSTLDY